MKKFISLLIATLFTLATFAQGEGAPGSASAITSHLKIYVAIGVLAIILLLIFGFLFSMERRLKVLEGK